MNEDKIKSACDLLNMTTDSYNVVMGKCMEAETEINKSKDVLMKLDEDLNYMETCNDRHKQTQSYMLERMQKETAAC